MTKPAFSPIKLKSIHPLNDTIIVSDMAFSERTLNSGIILPNDNGKSVGIRPRWGYVYAVGPKQYDVQVGQWICVSHGRWTRGVQIEDSEGLKTIRKVDPNDVLLVSDEPVFDETMSDKEV